MRAAYLHHKARSRRDVAALSFAYNGLDDRVEMVRGSDTRRFIYASDGRVLGEYGASAADVKISGHQWINPTRWRSCMGEH